MAVNEHLCLIKSHILHESDNLCRINTRERMIQAHTLMRSNTSIRVYSTQRPIPILIRVLLALVSQPLMLLLRPGRSFREQLFYAMGGTCRPWPSATN